MKHRFLIGLLWLAMSAPVWAAGADRAEPEQQGADGQWLRSILDQAVEAIEDHLEITGSLAPDDPAGERRRHLRFKFYPEGKSRSRDAIAAEAWIDQPADSHRHEWHFRFSVPTPPGLPVPLPDNVI